MADFRLAGKFMKSIPYIGDAIGVVQELTNPYESDLGQKMMNAGIVGLGEVGASVLTGGLDAVPDALELATALGYEADDPIINRLQKIAPLIQPEHYLRLLSYGGKHAPTEAYLEQARKDSLTPAEDQSIMGRLNRMRTPTVGGLVLPTR
jgi:hypothetical protein|tara:strand:+ start:478 stop:927 length:450 start_codon:yes stop_codon:yes gene_type:complete